ncbi:MAG: sigma-54 dependent transcriptional regulator [Calditrichia bacterium]
MMNTFAPVILIVDDEPRIRSLLGDILQKKGFRTYLADGAESALRAVREQKIHVALLDLMMPGMNGLQMLEVFKRDYPALPVVIMTAYGSVSVAVEAIKKGGYDFIEKPLDTEKLLVILKNAVEKTQLVQENEELRKNILQRYQMVGNSPAMRDIYRKIELIAPRESTVLITGETGTGKDLVAHSIHNLSPRISKPFVKINCAAIPTDLLESELFGHKKGAFTGAVQDKPGKFELAEGGTIFLDEIGETPPPVQAKLLQVLEEKKFYSVGDTRERQVDVRVVASTNRNLEAEAHQQKFRLDLFYRLNSFHLHLPALRERGEDIPDLVDYYLPRICDNFNIAVKGMAPEAKLVLINYSWPGNVRELTHILEQLIIFSEGNVINGSFVQEWLSKGPVDETFQEQISAGPLREAREHFEREHIRKALVAHNWNVADTATYLGIERTNLYRKMKGLGIDVLQN